MEDGKRQTLEEAWDEVAYEWADWASAPGHDHYYWRFNRPPFLELIRPPGRLTLDLGCGEGRLTRELAELGHSVVGVDASATLIRLAAERAPSVRFVRADAARLPFPDAYADLVIAFMSLMDVDDMRGAVAEAGRVLELGGRLCIAVCHPFQGAGAFESGDPDSPFSVGESYFDRRRIVETVEREGRRMTFHGMHWTLEDYSRALEDGGFAIELVREPVPPDDLVRDRPEVARWRRLPCFLHVRAVRR